MAGAVYLTAMGPASGKSIVALGLVELLSSRVPRVGFFRPIVQALPDNDLELIRSHYHLPDERIGHAFTAAERTNAGRATRAGMERIVERFKQIESASDFVVVEGTDFTGASSAAARPAGCICRRCRLFSERRRAARGIDRVYVTDPFGNRIELMQPTA